MVFSVKATYGGEIRRWVHDDFPTYQALADQVSDIQDQAAAADAVRPFLTPCFPPFLLDPQSLQKHRQLLSYLGHFLSHRLRQRRQSDC